MKPSTPRKIYFAHPINTYAANDPDGTLERDLLNLIASKWRGDVIVNPADAKHDEECKRLKAKDPDANVMGYFTDLVKSCDEVVVLPFPDGKWGAGVYKEAKAVLDLRAGKWVWVIDPATHVIRFVPKLDPALCLTVEETRSRIRYPDRTIRPYA